MKIGKKGIYDYKIQPFNTIQTWGYEFGWLYVLRHPLHVFIAVRAHERLKKKKLDKYLFPTGKNEFTA